MPNKKGKANKKRKKRERPNKKKKGPKKGKKKKKIKRGQCYYLFFHTCASKQHHVLHVVSLISCASKQHHVLHIDCLLCCHFHILVGIFHYRTWLVYSNDGLPQMPQVFMSKQVGCTPTQFLLLSFHTFIALVHPLHGNPYSSH